MTDKDRVLDEAALDALLAGVRGTAPEAPPALMARVLADAAAVQAGFSAPVAGTVRAAPPPSLVARMLDALGGWRGAGALAASACVGLILGLSSPDAVMGYLPVDTVESAEADLIVFDELTEITDLEG